MVIHTLNLALQHRELDDAAVCLSQVAMSREIKQMQLSVEPRVVERRFTRHRDYFTVPTSALRPQNRLELLREKPGFTLLLSGGGQRVSLIYNICFRVAISLATLKKKKRTFCREAQRASTNSGRLGFCTMFSPFLPVT